MNDARRTPPERSPSESWLFRVAQLFAGSRLDLKRAAAHWQHPQGDPGGLVYVALGDSVAQGIGAGRVDDGYVGLLAARLRHVTGGPVQVINLSVSGAQVIDVIEQQVAQLNALSRYDLVTLDVGGNDIRDFERSRFDAQISSLLDALPVATVVADLPYFMHGHWERDALEASRLVATRAERRGQTVVPIHATMEARGWRGMFRDYAPDFFHPNDRGHQLWADAFWPAVATTLELPA